MFLIDREDKDKVYFMDLLSEEIFRGIKAELCIIKGVFF